MESVQTGRCVQGGSAKANPGSDELIQFVSVVARTVKKRYGQEVEWDDLIAWGVQGALESLSRFDGARGKSWDQQAYWRTYGAMVDGLRQWSHRSHAHTLGARDRRRLKAKSCDPTHSNWEARSLESVERGCPETGTHPEAGWLGKTAEKSPETLATEEQVARKVGMLTLGLPLEERVILELVYHEEMSMKTIGEMLGRSKSWVSRKHLGALVALRRSIQENLLSSSGSP